VLYSQLRIQHANPHAGVPSTGSASLHPPDIQYNDQRELEAWRGMLESLAEQCDEEYRLVLLTDHSEIASLLSERLCFH
jgi:hypothetical protein